MWRYVRQDIKIYFVSMLCEYIRELCQVNPESIDRDANANVHRFFRGSTGAWHEKPQKALGLVGCKCDQLYITLDMEIWLRCRVKLIRWNSQEKIYPSG